MTNTTNNEAPKDDMKNDGGGHAHGSWSRRRLEIALLAIAVAVVLVVAIALQSNKSHHDATSTSTSGARPPTDTSNYGPLGDLARRQLNDPMALGRVDAPVVIVEFADYRCPFCAQFDRTVKPQIVSKYVDTGVVRIEFRDFPIYGAQSMSAARAGRAAAAQGRFWQFLDTVYGRAPQTGHPDLPADTLIKDARDAGVPDMARFQRDMNSTAFDKSINSDLDQGNSYGLGGTPAFSINGEPIIGTRDFSTFATVIDYYAHH